MDRRVPETRIRRTSASESDTEAEKPAEPPASRSLPPAGHLVWVPPNGPAREINLDHVALDTAEQPVHEGTSDIGRPINDDNGHARMAATCADCGYDRSVETIVRQHDACGHVRLDGFVDTDGGYTCPKCGTAVGDAFPIVGVVQSCLKCGRILDRPLAREHR